MFVRAKFSHGNRSAKPWHTWWYDRDRPVGKTRSSALRRRVNYGKNRHSHVSSSLIMDKEVNYTQEGWKKVEEKSLDRPNSSTVTCVHLPGKVGKVDPLPGTPFYERRENCGKVWPHINYSILNMKEERKYTKKDLESIEKPCGLA